MVRHNRIMVLLLALMLLVVMGGEPALAQKPTPPPFVKKGRITQTDRVAAAKRSAQARNAAGIVFRPNTSMVTKGKTPSAMPGPDYFGVTPNYANSPLPASVSIIGDGTGALATPVLDAHGVVTGFTLVSGGQDYTFADMNVIGGGGSGAYASAVVTNGAITGFTVVTGGSGYGTVPGIRKFVDAMPGLCDPTQPLGPQQNGLGQCIPIAIPDTISYPGSGNTPAADYYEVAVVEYTEQLHSDLPPTKLRGYVQVETSVVTSTNHVQLKYLDGTPILKNGQPVYGLTNPQYLGPTVIAQKDRPVRVKFYNFLPKGTGGDLFIPVDDTVMGSGMGAKTAAGANCDPTQPNANCADYTQNRATLHLHGGNTPWISDGTEHQWTTPAGENTPYPVGVSTQFVPDMDGGNEPQGTMTFYYTNQQSARLLFYHDHAYGITRLNVYAGEAAGYLVTDSVEQGLVTGGFVPAEQIPLIIQDKTFVPSTPQLAAEDPTWDLTKYGGYGSLWLPHVYMTNQNPYDMSGANPDGRWDYGPWFWPPFTGLVNTPIPNPLYNPNCNAATTYCEPPVMPATPNPSIVPEAFVDTPVVNGTAYPYLSIEPKPYRFRILNAANDRTWNLSLWQSDSTVTTVDGRTNTEVAMVPFNSTYNSTCPAPGCFPTNWYTAGNPFTLDDRAGGVPDPKTAGPSMIQIGTEAGFLPAPYTVPNRPVNYVYNRRDIVVLNVDQKALFLGPAERADVVVDFSQFAGKTLILYNDAPAPVPASDPRLDYYTGDPDQTSTGGAPSTQAGFGPNTRTVLQIRVAATVTTPSTAPNLSQLGTALPQAFAAGQKAPIVPQAVYNQAYNAQYPTDAFVRIQDTSMTFFNGPLTGLTLTNGGTGYTSAPTVTISGGGGNGASASATTGAPLANLQLLNHGSGFTRVPTVNFIGGGGTGAAATAVLSPTRLNSITVTNGGSGYITRPNVTITGGGGSGATATANIVRGVVTSIRVNTSGSGFTSMPTITLSGGGGTGVVAVANLVGTSIASLTLTNPGSNYSSAPTITFTQGGGSNASASVALGPGVVTSLTLLNGGTGYTSKPTIAFNGGGGSGAAATAIGVVMDLEPKSIIEDFDPDYGRMNAMLGVEIPRTTASVQTSIPYYDFDPPTEVLTSTTGIVNIGQAGDGTEIWKITHNGVDTHAIHFHMFDVQVLNRVGWDGAIRLPDPNEVGWKDTVRMNPLEDVIIATRPTIPNVPWDLPNSIRLLNVTLPLGSTAGFHNIDPTNEPANVTNAMVNFGWEYVWHCHLLGHEENIMMRSMAVAVKPVVPSNIGATYTGTPNIPRITVTWQDNSKNETAWVVERAESSAPNAIWKVIATVPTTTGPATGGTINYTDTSATRHNTYYYRVSAANTVGYTQTYAAPANGYPTVTATSDPTAISVGVPTP